MKNFRWFRLLSLALLVGAVGVAQAQQKGNETPEQVRAKALAYFTDTVLVDQYGKEVRFFSDVLDGKVVLINTMYTNCEDACPLITAQLKSVVQRLGDRFGKEIIFVSMSNDPKRDTPEAMREFAEKQKALLPGWHFLTGSESNVTGILKRLGQFSPNVEAHSTVLLAGNVRTAHWMKLRPEFPPDVFLAKLEALMLETPR